MWHNAQFRAYLGNTGFAGLALAMQQLLLSWSLIGILELPADQVGLLQGLVGVPAIFLMLLGGARSDNGDPKRLLIGAYLVAPIFPLFLLVMEQGGQFAVWSVLVWALGVSIVQAVSTPAQQAILNRISAENLQQGVTAATAIGFVVQVVGLIIAGQLDRVGMSTVLLLQGLSFLGAAIAMRYISSQAPLQVSPTSAVDQIRKGLAATLKSKVIMSVLLINFVSTIFNAGSFMTVFPFIVKRVYDGDALLLSILMAIFFGGAVLANSLLLKFQPLQRPGRLYLVLQLSRVIVLVMLFVKGDLWLLVAGTFLWGMNMGVTSNLARMIVQESAAAEYRGRILAVFSVSMVGSAPIGAIVLGVIIETVGTLEALLPAMLVSVLLAAYGAFMTPIWKYTSEPTR
ncbi:MAG: MFS transporter [Pseudomonadales bacterium]